MRSPRALTGSNPRTAVILYELLAAGWEGDVHSDLKALLDLMTPLYKACMEQLAEQPRKLLALLMEHWDPIGAGDLTRTAGLPPTTVSGRLSRLTAEGLVEKVSLAKTSRAGYQASERFFNIWYLMRYTPRRTRRRLTRLVEFIRLWFSTDDLRRQALHSLDQLRGAHPGDRSLDYALALTTLCRRTVRNATCWNGPSIPPPAVSPSAPTRNWRRCCPNCSIPRKHGIP